MERDAYVLVDCLPAAVLLFMRFLCWNPLYLHTYRGIALAVQREPRGRYRGMMAHRGSRRGFDGFAGCIMCHRRLAPKYRIKHWLSFASSCISDHEFDWAPLRSPDWRRTHSGILKRLARF